MSTTRNVSTQFKGILAAPILDQVFKASDTINKGLITVLPNVIGNAMLPKLTVAQSLALDTCGWNPTGTINLTEKEVTTKRYALQLEFCKLDFANTYVAAAEGAMSEVPQTVQEAIMLDLIGQAGELIDSQIWNGNDSTAQFNGLLRQFTADTQVIDVAAFSGSVDSTNVFAELSKVYNAIPKEVKKQAVIVVSDDIESAYKLYQGTILGGSPVGDKPMDFAGIRMESVGGLPAKTIVAYRVKNVSFATGLSSELNSVDVVDSDATNLDNLVKARVSFNAGVGYFNGAEIVYYR